jgi:hypothetical protein
VTAPFDDEQDAVAVLHFRAVVGQRADERAAGIEWPADEVGGEVGGTSQPRGLKLKRGIGSGGL